MVRLASALFVLVLAACRPRTSPEHSAGPEPLAAPRPAPRPRVVHAQGGDRVDPYYWLRDDARNAPEVLAHLRAENAYTDAQLAPLARARAALYAEMVGRMPEEDASAPVIDHGYAYTTRYVRGGEQPLVTRRALPNGAEQTLIDGNALARRTPYFELGDYAVSDDGRVLAYTVDEQGRGEFVLRLRDLALGADLPDELRGIEPSLALSADGSALVYIEKDPATLLGSRVKLHRLGTARAADRLLYEEADRAFFLGLSKSPSRRFVIVQASSTEADETLVADATDPALPLAPVIPRSDRHKYEVGDRGPSWIVRTNLGAPNFRIVELARGERDLGRARELVPEPARGGIEGMAVLDQALAYEERREGLVRVRVRRFEDGLLLPGPDLDAASTERLDELRDPGRARVAVRQTGFVLPDAVVDRDLVAGTDSLVKRDEVRGGFDPARFRSERLEIAARDGAAVPVTLLMRRDHVHDGSAPLYLTGYGAYGISEDPEFSSARLSLVERGVVFAVAHVRGGQELGRAWYDAGRLAHKQRTFDDFVDVARALVARGVADPARLAARGASAGGLLIGAVANQAPNLFKVLVAHVPFVDVVTTMLDPSIPLTTNEYEEWGNPEAPRWYEIMLAYSPYDNVRAQAYPAMYVSTGLWDPRVQYYEPAKWVAKLRATKTDDRPLVLRVNMDAGHGGRSGRFAHRHELAEEYAFVLRELGVALP